MPTAGRLLGMRDKTTYDPALIQRRLQRLTKSVSELATGRTTVEQLGHRLTNAVDGPPARNLVRGREAIGHANVSAHDWHGGIIPTP